MADNGYLTQRDAAAVCSVSADTIRRHRRHGRLPNSTLRDDGTVLVAVSDLVAAGLLALSAATSVGELVSQGRMDKELTSLRIQLAVAVARNEEMAARVRFLEHLVKAGGR